MTDTMLLPPTLWIPQRISLLSLRRDIRLKTVLVYRLLEVKLEKHDFHVITNDLIITLKIMNVADIHNVEYMVLYNDSQTLDALTQTPLLPLDQLHYRP